MAAPDAAAPADVPADVISPVCAVCGAVATGPDDPVVLTTWARERDGERDTWTCADCSRRHVRDIEGKLDVQWW